MSSLSHSLVLYFRDLPKYKALIGIIHSDNTILTHVPTIVINLKYISSNGNIF